MRIGDRVQREAFCLFHILALHRTLPGDVGQQRAAQVRNTSPFSQSPPHLGPPAAKVAVPCASNCRPSSSKPCVYTLGVLKSWFDPKPNMTPLPTIAGCWRAISGARSRMDFSASSPATPVLAVLCLPHSPLSHPCKPRKNRSFVRRHYDFPCAGHRSLERTGPGADHTRGDRVSARDRAQSFFPKAESEVISTYSSLRPLLRCDFSSTLNTIACSGGFK
jgi:hypothetical protein